uniref:Secreted protein n=1 Tax=Mesocestoides corti TaxID=53468 RepID=A0A5K3G0V9_MESCO
AEYQCPNRKKTGTTEKALLTIHKPEPHVRSRPSESTTLATPLIMYCTSVVSFSGWLPIFLACQRASVVQYVSALRRRHITLKECVTHHSSFVANELIQGTGESRLNWFDSSYTERWLFR